MAKHKGKQVLLTGGLGSLGRAQAARLIAGGAAVTILEHPGVENGAARAADIGASFLACDLNDLEAAKTTVADAANAAGGFDILINNAALIINRPYEAFSLTEYEDQIRVNSSAAFALTTVCAEHMKAKGWGRVINFTSVTLKGIIDGYVPYVASKGAMLGLTVSLARELGRHGITVNAVAPGAVVSEAEARVFADKAQEYSDWVQEQQCLKTRIQPDDVADLVSFLVSEEARVITGQNVGIDGGWQGGKAPGTD
ncbi:SDR family oxidoreductase [Thiosulfatihalobacter marinus]|jgi:NAD(P)-dependent dehydrogenase (short-subunit alcohol dehydrogenase family)|uniref:SDR family oxidoreductase n=1 Tax=Thiosulfatihalobacter marinus TaxID=2792481 RepID=UPI0018D8AD5B|nr:SDR family oxidoreductase [Thiosulfatihalobacter marinus]